MMTQEEREAAYERVLLELGIDRIGTEPDAPALPPRQGGARTKPGSGLPIEAELLGVQMFEYGEIWPRPGLDLRTRCFITMAALTALGHGDRLYRHVNSALNIGITPEGVHEALLQAGVYSGLSAWENAVAVANEVFVARKILPAGEGVAVEPKAPMDHEDRRTAMKRVVDALGVGRLGLGQDALPLVPMPGPMSGAQPGRTPVEQDLTLIVAEYGYGEVWGRPGLDLRTRSFVTVAVLQAMRENDQLHIHLNNALNLGISADEIHEALAQVGIYGGGSGWHNANNVARHVLGQRSIGVKE
jgi:4-carboxymuconolactone decarboxylase